MIALAALLAAGGAGADTFRMVPNVTLGESYSDNLALLPGDIARSGWITEITPSIRAELAGARVKGSLDFRLQDRMYSDSRLDNTQRFLSSFAKVEAVERFLFVDARASISQQNRTAFGTIVTPDATTATSNRIETKAYQISPYIRGDYSGVASYQLRFTETHASANDITLPDTRTSEWVAKVGNATRSAKLGWSIDANALRLHNDVVGTVENSRVRGTLIFAMTPQFHVSAFEGHESTDFVGPPRRGKDTPGLGLEWTPSVRTQLSAVYEKRFFGDGHNAVFSHRTPRTVWKVISSKDTQVLPSQLAASGLNSVAALMSDLLISSIPDPQERTEAVRRRLEEYGISGSSAIGSNFLTSRPFALKSTVATVAMLGATNTVTFTVSNREQRAFGLAVGGVDTLDSEDFRQTAFNANFAHKLTPLTTVTFAATHLRTVGLTNIAKETRQGTYGLFITSRLGPKTTASFGVQHLDFNSSTAPESYRENAIFGTVSVRM